MQMSNDVKKYKTEQEYFWSGEFGNDYINRNSYEDLLPGNISKWSNWISKTSGINSCIEFGANIGANLLAIRSILPKCELNAIEINEKACDEYLSKFVEKKNIFNGSILDYNIDRKFDLSFICGVLIHINPDVLPQIYEKLYNASSKYIIVAEYYNPTPVAIDYRGNKDRLFKRDFAGEIMDKYPDLKLVDYGFLYHRDNNFHFYDDINWFLLEKKEGC